MLPQVPVRPVGVMLAAPGSIQKSDSSGRQSPSVKATTIPLTRISSSRGRSAGPIATSASVLHQASNNPAAPPSRAREHRLDEKLTDDLKAVRAQRGSDRNFTLSRSRARQKKICHICAGDQQDERDRSGRARAMPGGTSPTSVGLKINCALRSSSIGVRILFCQLGCDRLQVGCRGAQIDSRFRGDRQPRRKCAPRWVM